MSAGEKVIWEAALPSRYESCSTRNLRVFLGVFVALSSRTDLSSELKPHSAGHFLLQLSLKITEFWFQIP